MATSGHVGDLVGNVGVGGAVENRWDAGTPGVSKVVVWERDRWWENSQHGLKEVDMSRALVPLMGQGHRFSLHTIHQGNTYILPLQEGSALLQER